MPRAATARILDRHVVLVLIDRLDLAAARAIQYARTLTPDELRAVHFVLDPQRADELAEAWRRLGLTTGAARTARSAPTACSTAPPSRSPPKRWPTGEPRCRFCSPTASTRVGSTGSCMTARPTRSPSRCPRLPHANVTRVPYHLGTPASWDDLPTVTASPGDARQRDWAEPAPSGATEQGDRRPRPRTRHGGHRRRAVAPAGPHRRHDPVDPRAAERRRADARVRGRPTAPAACRSCSSGAARSPASRSAAASSLEGMVGSHAGRLAILNPVYELLFD